MIELPSLFMDFSAGKKCDRCQDAIPNHFVQNRCWICRYDTASITDEDRAACAADDERKRELEA